jgi:hypothetical protein
MAGQAQDKAYAGITTQSSIFDPRNNAVPTNLSTTYYGSASKVWSSLFFSSETQ